MADRQFCRRLVIAFCGMGIFVLGITGTLVWALGPGPFAGKPLLVAKNTSDPRLQVVCTQEFDGGEPYVVSLWFRRPGEPWHWLYVEHEDTYWWSGSIRVDADAQGFQLYRGDKLVASTDLVKDEYMLNGSRHDRALAYDASEEPYHNRMLEFVEAIVP